MAKHHIKNGVITIGGTGGTGGTAVRFHTGEINTSTEAVEISDSGSGGAQEFLPGGGLDRGEFNFEIYWDDAAMPHTLTPPIRSGQIVPFTATLITGKSFSGNVYLEEVNYALGDVDGTDAINVEVSGQISGPLTYPTSGP